MVGFGRSGDRHRRVVPAHPPVPGDTPAARADPDLTEDGLGSPGADTATAPAPAPQSHGVLWAVLGVAVVLVAFLLVPFGLERSSAVAPATSTGPAVPPSASPQTWVLSSTVVAPGPVAVPAHGARAEEDASDSTTLIVRVPATGTRNPAGDSGSAPAREDGPTPGTATFPTSGAPGSGSSCADVTPTRVPPILADTLGGDLGSSGTGDGPLDAGDTGNTGDTNGAGGSPGAPAADGSCAG